MRTPRFRRKMFEVARSKRRNMGSGPTERQTQLANTFQSDMNLGGAHFGAASPLLLTGCNEISPRGRAEDLCYTSQILRQSLTPRHKGTHPYYSLIKRGNLHFPVGIGGLQGIAFFLFRYGYVTEEFAGVFYSQGFPYKFTLPE